MTSKERTAIVNALCLHPDCMAHRNDPGASYLLEADCANCGATVLIRRMHHRHLGDYEPGRWPFSGPKCPECGNQRLVLGPSS